MGVAQLKLFASGTVPIMTKKKVFRVVRTTVNENNQLDLFEDAWYHFVYSDNEGNEVTHPTPFSSEEKALHNGQKWVEFLNA